MIWNYFGGSVWEINSFLSLLMDNAIDNNVSNKIIQKEAEKRIHTYKIRFQDYIGKHYDHDLFTAINNILLHTEYFYIKDLMKNFDRRKLKEELGILVQNNLFSYNPLSGQ